MKSKTVMQGAVGILCILLASSCAVTPESSMFGSMGRTWPEAPEVARVAFVGQFSNARDLSIRENFWSALVSAVAGTKNYDQSIGLC